MSKKKKNKRKQKQGPSPEERWILTKRRIALSVYLVFLVLAAVGSQGPWWQVINTHTDKPLKAKPDYGNDYRRWEFETTDDPKGPKVLVENPMRPAVIALLGCAVGFFFASYNLVADQNLHIPVLLATLVVAGSAAFVFYDFYRNETAIRGVIEIIEESRVKKELAASPAGVAPATSGPRKPSLADALVVRFHWGLALLLSASIVMLLDSLYMTFFAQRKPAECP